MIKIIKISGFLFIIVGILIPVFSFTKYKVEEKIYVAKVDNKLINNNYDYFAIIEISKINLKRELYQINNLKNNLDKNILVHESSIFPNGSNSNVVLASHSGSGSNAYFKHLYKLNIGDIITLYFNGNIYEYEKNKEKFIFMLSYGNFVFYDGDKPCCYRNRTISNTTWSYSCYPGCI